MDFDECAEMTAHCPPNSSCKNRNGSYECKCNSGFTLQSSDQASSSHNEAIECVPSKDNMHIIGDNENGDKKDKKKGRSGDKSGQAQSTSNGTFNVPRNIEIELEKAPVSLTDILQLR